LYINARGGGAVLTAVDVATYYSTIGGSFDICIIIYDKGCLTTKFEMHMFDRIGTGVHDLFAAFCATSYRDHVDLLMAGECLCYTGAAGNNVEDPWR
jgi:hypothetical protein